MLAGQVGRTCHGALIGGMIVREDKVSATDPLAWNLGKENIYSKPSIQFTAICGGKLKYRVMRNHRFRLPWSLSEGGAISGMLEFLATDTEVSGSIPCATRFSE